MEEVAKLLKHFFFAWISISCHATFLREAFGGTSPTPGSQHSPDPQGALLGLAASVCLSLPTGICVCLCPLGFSILPQPQGPTCSSA